MVPMRILSYVTGSRYLKMAAAKPEVLISQLLDKIVRKFQRLNRYFEVQELIGTTSGSIRNSVAALLDPENGGLAVATAFISSLEAEI